jgi:hypothetical protein
MAFPSLGESDGVLFQVLKNLREEFQCLETAATIILIIGQPAVMSFQSSFMV